MPAANYGSKPINPQSYYVRRPYMGRYGYGGGGLAGQPTPGAFEAGQRFAQDIVGGIAQLNQQRQQQAQQDRLNEVANQLIAQQLNTQNAPRAALAGQGTLSNPDWLKLRQSNVNFQGTAPQTGMGGGLAELQLRQQFAQQQLANQINQARLAAMLRSLNAPPGPAITPYQQQELRVKQDQLEREQEAAVQAETKAAQEKTAITEGSLIGQFDKRYGKGEAQNYLNAYQAGSLIRGRLGTDADGDLNGKFIRDDNGDWVTTDQSAVSTPGKPGGLFGMGGTAPVPGPDFNKVKKIRFSDLQAYANKLQDVQDAGGKLYPNAPRALPVGAAPPPGTEAARLAGAVPVPATAPSVAGQSADSGTALADQANPFAEGGSLYNWSMGGQATDQTSGQADTSSLATPQTQADYDAIPSGSQFVDIDGITKTKY
jgi:hypothetical protein